MNTGISIRSGKLLTIVALMLLAAQVQAISTAALQQGIPSLAPMLEQVTPAVVSISVSKAMPTAGRYFFNGKELPEGARRFFGEVPDRTNEVPQSVLRYRRRIRCNRRCRRRSDYHKSSCSCRCLSDNSAAQ